MNAISDVATINRFATALENAEARRLGVKVGEARGSVARRLGVAPGTLENLRRLRTKIVPNWLMNKARTELVAVLQMEVQRLEHEIHLARQIGSDHRDSSLHAAEAQLSAARKILEGE